MCYNFLQFSLYFANHLEGYILEKVVYFNSKYLTFDIIHHLELYLAKNYKKVKRFKQQSETSEKVEIKSQFSFISHFLLKENLDVDLFSSFLVSDFPLLPLELTLD